MSILRLIIKTFTFYLRHNLLVITGIILSTLVLTGALVIGDSMEYSLLKSVYNRLGKVHQSLHAGERLLTMQLAQNLQDNLNQPLTAVLESSGSAVSGNGNYRLNDINLWGIDQNFDKVTGAPFNADSIRKNSVFVSENMAKILNINIGDQILLKLNQINSFPSNSPFVTHEGQIKTERVTVERILSTAEFARFNLSVSQSAPYNCFVNAAWLNEIMKLDQNIHLILSDKQLLNYTLTDSCLSYKDASLHIRYNPARKKWAITSDRIFFNNHLTDSILNYFPKGSQVLTWFVNEFRTGQNSVPYSFISGVSDENILHDEIVINQWLAKELNATIGDTVKMKYFITGPFRNLTEDSISLKISQIVPIEGIYDDQSLMPKIPGLSDAGSCSDWNAGIPVDLEKITPRDEDYWNKHRGTPKAFINYELAAQLWKNRFGNTSLVLIDSTQSKEEFIKELNNVIDPNHAGIEIVNLTEEGIRAAKEGVDFSQLFIGLSFFILLSGIILTILLLNLNLNLRKSQFATLSSLGFTKKILFNIFLAEGVVIALIGSVTGSILSVFYTKIIFRGLNSIWNDIVRTDVLEISVQPQTLLTGAAISFFIGIATILLVLISWSKKELSLLQNSQSKNVSFSAKFINQKVSVLKHYLAPFLLFLASVIIITGNIVSEGENYAAWFFLCGILLLLSFMLTIHIFFKYGRSFSNGSFTTSEFITVNMRYRRKEHFYILSILSLATFIVISTGANRQNTTQLLNKKTSGTGGFLFFAKSAIPVLNDLNENEYRKKQGFAYDWSAVQFMVNEKDDASCLNLNRVSSPTIIATNPENLKGRFSFQKSMDKNREGSWDLLSGQRNGLIPAIADQTVIKWSLGKQAGDTLKYLNEAGDTIMLQLVAGTKPSLFQGYVIISEENFIENFPSLSGSGLMLIDGATEDMNEIKEELQFNFRDYGLMIEPSAEKLARFNSVQNTYLSIFLALGSLGILIGIFGLGIVIKQSIMNRKKEIGILLACGFQKVLILKLFTREYVIILFLAIGTGALAAIISILPVFINGLQEMSILSIILLPTILVAIGWFWIWIITRRSIAFSEINTILRS